MKVRIPIPSFSFALPILLILFSAPVFHPGRSASAMDQVSVCGYEIFCVDLTATCVGVCPSVSSSVPEAVDVAPATADHRRPIETAITSLATAAGASAGVSVQQLAEPFALVAPYLEDSFASVWELDRWWEHMRHQAQAAMLNDDLDQRISAKSVDVESFGASVLVSTFASTLTPNLPVIEITPLDPLVGSAPMIATLNEPYRPYDLAENDLQVWSVYPSYTPETKVTFRGRPSPPLCIYPGPHHLDVVVAEPTLAEVDEILETVAVSQQNCVEESVDHAIRQWTVQAKRWNSEVRAMLKPQAIGVQVASLTSGGRRLLYHVARTLLIPPQSGLQVLPVPNAAGKALLVRAGATDSEPAAPIYRTAGSLDLMLR